MAVVRLLTGPRKMGYPTMNDVPYSLGQSSIDLGSYGKLIAPVQADGGNWYYFWDRSGDGTSSDGNHLADRTTHDVLDAIFNTDIFGNLGSGNTTDTYRYANLNGVQVALVTSGVPAGTAQGFMLASTSISGATVNPTYDGLAAIWDGYGTPPGWALGTQNNDGAHYWSASAASTNILSVILVI